MGGLCTQSPIVTTSLAAVLDDPDVAAVFVSATPAAHYRIATAVLRKGKALFIEKPPCRTLDQLESLVALQRQTCTPAMVGLQKRFAPAVIRLSSCLKGNPVYNYSLRYCIGRYPEGDPFTELFIHPLDLVTHLFGPAEIIMLRHTGCRTTVLMLAHGDTVGTVELSTGYSWAAPVEELIVHTRSGVYAIPSIDTLTFQPASTSFASIPWEKITHPHVAVEYLCRHDAFTPTLAASPWVEHGFYHELKAFVDEVEHRPSNNLLSRNHLSPIRPTLQSLLPVYQLLTQMAIQKE
jgi:virulence factor